MDIEESKRRFFRDMSPEEMVAEDEAALDALAKMAIKQIGEAFSPNEFADWEQPAATD